MTQKRMAILTVLLLAAIVGNASEKTSIPQFVIFNPDTSSFWRTATNDTITVPVELPAGATAASLLVEGLDYHRKYENLGPGDFTFSLPAPTAPEMENVYRLTLSFDDEPSTARTATLGLIQGLRPDAEGKTRCLAPADNNRKWKRVNGRAVLPIPYGTTSLEVNGESVDTGLNGAQGWYALDGLSHGTTTDLSLVVGGSTCLATLIGGPGGLLIFFR